VVLALRVDDEALEPQEGPVDLGRASARAAARGIEAEAQEGEPAGR
jgi:hypothetical protein